MKLGYGFADGVGFSKKRPRIKTEISQEEEKTPLSVFTSRLMGFYLLLVLSILLLFVRLIQLQITEGSRNRQIADGNRIRIKTLPAPRGIITDRHGEVLIRNVPGYRLRIGDQKCESGFCSSEFKPVRREKALQIEAQGGTEAANLEVDILREYIYPKSLAHLLGYTGEISQPELDSGYQLKGYQVGDKIGRSGLEKEYEDLLKGKKGQQLIEVDAKEKKLGVLREIPPQLGQNITLSIDLSLQKKADEALGDEKGAVIVSDPQSGEILALVSHPSFDPNVFTLEPDPIKIEELLTDEGKKPLFNRAVSGLYPPGSTFKIITSAAGLESGKITSDTQIEDTGEIAIGPYRFPNWYFKQYGKTEGALEVTGALGRSNDIFFYKVAEWVGENNLGEWAKKFGLGQKLGIDLGGESEGLVPTPQWKEKTIGDKWYLGDTYHFGIGQGYLLVTPLQVNSWTSVIASGGKLYRPHLVKNTVITQVSADKQNMLKKETLNLIREGMKQACSPGGTGWPLFNFKVGEREIQTGCKTGTAEYGDLKGRTHAWFTVFAPWEDPEIVVTVLVENGGEGSNTAAPLAKKILEEYFQK